uniref:hypothetical protein n=1 Tax=Klebsiella pneumoniae TaxID=573 RepID=UPI00359C34CD
MLFAIHFVGHRSRLTAGWQTGFPQLLAVAHIVRALVYGLVAIGGWLGDKVLGTKRVIMLGAIVLAIGYALVACFMIMVIILAVLAM